MVVISLKKKMLMGLGSFATIAQHRPANLSIISPPSNGTVSINAFSGLVTYTPNAGFFGADSFTFTATGPGGGRR